MGIDVDMSLEGCHSFWGQFQDKNVGSIIELMEQVEDWTLDHDPEVAQKLIDLGKALADAPTGRTIEDFESILSLCVCVRMSMKLRFMQAIDQLDPGSAARLIQYAEKNQFSSNNASLFLKRNIVFERMRMIARILNPDRIDALRKTLDKNT